MLNASQLKGIIPAIPTPILNDNTVDPIALTSLFEWILPRGIDGILPLGGTGEYGALSRRERIRMAELSVQGADGKVPVIPGILDPGFYDAEQSGKDFARAGVDALLVLTPYYTNPSQDGIRDYFLRYADSSPVPILIYEIPYRTRIAIEPRIIHELSRHERIIGMKACNTDMYHFLQVMSGIGPDFSVLSGEDSLFPLHMAAGAHGGIIVTATMFPKFWKQLYKLGKAEQIAEAIALHREMIPLLNLAFSETNPGPMKAVWDLINVHAPAVLAPLMPCEPAIATALRQAAITQIAISEQAG